MEKVITLEEAIRTRIIKEGDLVNPYSLYTKTAEKLSFCEKDTGTKQFKVFDREKNLKSFYCADLNGIPTLWFSTTDKYLILNGEKGFLNGTMILNRICNLFSNIENGMIARSITEKDIEHLIQKNVLRQKPSEFDEPFWVGSSCIINNAEGEIDYCMLKAYNYHINPCELYSSNGKKCTKKSGIRPVLSIYLPSKIFVDLESKDEDGAWVLKLLKNKC